MKALIEVFLPAGASVSEEKTSEEKTIEKAIWNAHKITFSQIVLNDRGSIKIRLKDIDFVFLTGKTPQPIVKEHIDLRRQSDENISFNLAKKIHELLKTKSSVLVNNVFYPN